MPPRTLRAASWSSPRTGGAGSTDRHPPPWREETTGPRSSARPSCSSPCSRSSSWASFSPIGSSRNGPGRAAPSCADDRAGAGAIPVDIPADYGRERRGGWHLIEVGGRGLLVPDERGSAVVYVLREPDSHYCRVTTGSGRRRRIEGDRWPASGGWGGG